MENIICKILKKGDSELMGELLQVYEEVFEVKNFKMPSQSYLENLLGKEHAFFHIALSEGRVVGGLSGYILPMLQYDGTEMYIYDVGVKTSHQRRGIGRKLIDSVKEHAKQLNCKTIFVQADSEDQHAIDFYTATGAEMTEVRHFTYTIPDHQE